MWELGDSPLPGSGLLDMGPKDTDDPVGPEKAPFLRFLKNGDLQG